jgi:putative membrane protein insertion efficiency factor|tara:strand:- start:1291 stop:1533 length:243 start_codon:yes stop_codon:yes gene_type:complete
MLKKLIISIIKIYRAIISPLFPPSCRYLPTCSEYSIDAIKDHGVLKGLFLGIKRILRCHPFNFLGGSNGYDPVPTKRINR